MSELEDRIASLPPAKRALFAARLAESRQRSAARARIPRRSEAGPAPLSFTQQRIWFLDQLYPGLVAYNSSIAIRFSGSLDARALEGSWNEVLRRHDVLRTVIKTFQGAPAQQIVPYQPVRLARKEVGMSGAGRKEAAYRLVVEEARVPFDLRVGPLYRATLLDAGEQEHILILIFHHIVFDGWSTGILLRELVAGYEAALRGESAGLPELPIQYADFAVWQRTQLTGAQLHRQVELWSRKLEGLAGGSLLSLDRPRPAEPTFHGARIVEFFPKELANALRAIAHAEGSTLFMLMLAAFKVLLARCSGQTDIVVGTAMANRERSELEGLIGFFANSLALRTDLSGDPLFRDLLGKVREATLSAYDSQEVPFEKLVEELNPERHLNRNPFFDISFTFQNFSVPAPNIPGVTVELMRVDNGTAKLDLSVFTMETDGGLQVAFEYSLDLFEAETPRRLLHQYRTLLEGIAADPARRIADLPLQTAAERLRVLTEFAGEEVEDKRRECVHDLIRNRGMSSPDSAALEMAGTTMTYRELDERATALARQLRAEGVKRGDVVGICLEAGFGRIVAVLGVMNAGAAYLPLDPHYPPERLAFIAEDSDVRLILTDGLGRFPGRKELAPGDISAGTFSSSPPLPAVSLDDPAYMIYTSGSTGRPKGVKITHQGLSNLAATAGAAFGISSRSRVVQMASFSFDTSVIEIFPALSAGATLCLGSREQLLPGPDLHRFLGKQRISCMILAPSLLRLLPDAPLPHLAVIVCGGEVCTADLVNRWAPGRRFFNAYGPTETTVCATFAECQASMSAAPHIGRPLPNVRIYILEPNGEPAPAGLPGELCIGGIGVAQGYWKRPERTAKQFCAEPFSHRQGAGMYRTGDIARFRDDGCIEYLGRRDDQVKIRGNRIELGEIENVLRDAPGVRQAAVKVLEDESTEERLVGYVVGDPPDEGLAGGLDLQEVRAHVLRHLPTFMVPSALVALERLPLTAHGKVDREALPAPAGARVAGRRPSGPTEQALSDMFCELLEREPAGADESFFELGGHSLLAMRLAKRLEAAFSISVPVRVIFDHPTVSGLARQIEVFAEAERHPGSGDETARRTQFDPAALEHLLEEVESLPEKHRHGAGAAGEGALDRARAMPPDVRTTPPPSSDP